MKWILKFYAWLRPGDGDIHYNVMTDLTIIMLSFCQNFCQGVICLICCVIIGLAKEIHDAYDPQHHTPDVHDLYADLCGILRGLLLYSWVILIRLMCK